MRIALILCLLLYAFQGSDASLFSRIRDLSSKITSKLPLPSGLKNLLTRNSTNSTDPLKKIPDKNSPKVRLRSFLPKGLPIPVSKYHLFGIPLVGMGGSLVNDKKNQNQKPAAESQLDSNATDETGIHFKFGLGKIGLEANYAFPKLKVGPFEVKPALGGGCMIRTPLANQYHKIEEGDNFVMGCSQFKCSVRLGRIIKFPVWLPECFRQPGLEVGERCCMRPDNLSKGGFVSCAETNIVTWLFGLDGRRRKVLGMIPNYLG